MQENHAVKPPALLAGAAKEDITPTMPLRLAGFGDRQGNYQQVLEPLYVRCLYLKQGEVSVALLSADILWWGSDLTERVQREAEQRYGLLPQSVLLSATHNHSGPPTDHHVLEQLETYSPEYADYLFEKAVAVIGQAMDKAQPARLIKWKGQCALNVNRRLLVKGKIEMMPNYLGPQDRNVTLLRVESVDGQVIAQMHHYACHATVSAENNVQPEYPGIANRLLDEMFPGSVNLFWQGATADLRPNIVLGDQFMKLGYKESQVFAQRYVAHLLEILESPGEQLDADLFIQAKTVELPLDSVHSDSCIQQLAEGEDTLERAWARKVLKDHAPPVQSCHITLVRLGKECPLLFFNAELVQRYAQFARTTHPGCLCICYTNGMIGYLCGEEEMAQGGYEPLDSHLWFTLRGPYGKKTQHLMEDAIRQLLTKEE